MQSPRMKKQTKQREIKQSAASKQQLDRIDEDVTESDSAFSSEGGSASDQNRHTAHNRLQEKGRQIKENRMLQEGKALGSDNDVPSKAQSVSLLVHIIPG